MIPRDGMQYMIKVTATNECSKTTSESFKVRVSGKPCDPPTSIGSARKLVNAYTVYPNPATDLVVINSKRDNAGISEIILTDLTGKKVKQFKSSGHLPQRLNISGLPEGMYIINLKDGEGNMTNQKLLME